jgi:hypothetical protein
MAGATSLVQLIRKKFGDDAAKVAAPAAGLLAAGQSEDADAGFITKGGKTLLEAFHGSPHKFDNFSMDQIGTGEGAQAYGHGLYFADSEDVAKQYRDTLSLNGYQDNNANYSKALELGLSAGEFDRFEGMVRMAATKDGLDAGRISADLQEYLQWPDDSMPALESFVGDYLNTLPKGHLYRTEIDVTPESLLDWDKPLSEQSQYVREQLGAVGDSKKAQEIKDKISELSKKEGAIYREAEGQAPTKDFDSLFSGPDNGLVEYQIQIEDLKRELENLTAPQYIEVGGRRISPEAQKHYLGRDLIQNNLGLAGSKEMSGALLDRGVPGIKYLDGDSRAVGDGTSNYVIFDDGLINIAERGNADPRLLAGTAAGTAGLLATPALMKDGVFQHGATSEPVVEKRKEVNNQSSLLESVTDFGDEVISNFKNAAGPLSLLMPYEGVNDYLKTVNDNDKKPTWWDRLGLLDL